MGTFGLIVDVAGKPVDVRFGLDGDKSGELKVADLAEERLVQAMLNWNRRNRLAAFVALCLLFTFPASQAEEIDSFSRERIANPELTNKALRTWTLITPPAAINSSARSALTVSSDSRYKRILVSKNASIALMGFQPIKTEAVG